MWYVVQTVAGREFAVCRLIESLVEDDVLQECFVPRYEVQKQFRGQWRTCTATLFPGYLIVVTDRVDELESQLRRVPAFAWVLSNDNVAGAIVGASRPEQVASNAAAAGVTLDATTLAAIDEALGDIVQRDPALTAESTPKTRPA